MPVALIAEWYVAVTLIVVGLSHVTSPGPWALLFKDLLARPYGGLFIGLFTLIPAVPLVAAHNIWKLDLFLIVTIVAWGQVFKGTLYLIRPEVAARVAADHLEHPGRFRIAGLVAVCVGGTVLLAWLQRPG